MPTTNEILQDEAITHALYLQGYTKHTTAKIINILKRSDADLIRQLEIQLDKLPQSQFNLARIDALLISVNDLISSAYNEASAELSSELKSLASYEAGYQSALFASVLPSQVAFVAVTGDQAYSAAMSRPFQGRLLKEWVAGLDKDVAVKVRDAVRIGYIEGETISQIVKRIRGTRALKYADGLLDINRRNAETIVRTAISHTASFTRELSYQANAKLLNGVQWSSTLDGKTSSICQLRDHKIYDVETHKPIGHSLPWLGGPGRAHMNCRSSSVGVLKSWRELGLNIDEIDGLTRASMDGQVPRETTYAEWLKGKAKTDPAFVDEVLGKTKGKLFREGGLTLDKFYAKDGKPYTLDQLKARDASAFKKVGL